MSLSYSLTDYTGSRKNEGREMVVMTFEVRRHTLLVSTISLLISLVVALPFFLLFGAWALVLPVAGMFAGNLLFASRQRRGLQVYRYKSLLNTRNAARGFWISGAQFAQPEFIVHVPTVIPIAVVDEDHSSRRETDSTTPQFVRGQKDASYVGEHRTGVRNRYA